MKKLVFADQELSTLWVAPVDWVPPEDSPIRPASMAEVQAVLANPLNQMAMQPAVYCAPPPPVPVHQPSKDMLDDFFKVFGKKRKKKKKKKAE